MAAESRRWIARARALLALGLVALGALGVGGAAAAEPTALQTDQFDHAPALDQPYAGHLKAGRDGHFAYYSFYYPADGSTATVNVQMWPDDAIVLKNAGMKIFGPRANKEYLVGGQQPGVRPNVSGNVISQDPNDRGTYTIQLYNYDWNAPIDFTIEVQGVAAAPTPAPAAGGAAAAAPPNTSGDAAVELVGRHEGVLAPGGKDFRYYRFDYPGDESVVSINMQIWPDESLLLQNVGFRVYGPKPDRAPLVAGIRQGLNPNLSLDVINREAGTYVVQLYNYDPVRSAPFTIWATQGE